MRTVNPRSPLTEARLARLLAPVANRKQAQAERERASANHLAECESKLRDAIADRDAIDRVRDSERYELECLRLDRSGQDYFERHTEGNRWSEISPESRRDWTVKATEGCGYAVGQAMHDIDIMYPRGSGSAGLIDALHKVAPDPGMERGQSVCDWWARLAWAIDEPTDDTPRNLFVVPDSQLELARSYVAGADPDGVAVLDLDILAENAGLAARASGVEALGFEGIRGLGLLDGIRELAAERDAGNEARAEYGEASRAARDALRNAGIADSQWAPQGILDLATQRDEARIQRDNVAHRLKLTEDELAAAREAMARAELDPTITIAEAITALDEAVCDASRAESVALGTARRERDAAQDRVVQLGGDLVVRTAERDELAGQLAKVRAVRDAALLSNSAARTALYLRHWDDEAVAAKQYASDCATIQREIRREWEPSEAARIAKVIRDVLTGREPSL